VKAVHDTPNAKVIIFDVRGNHGGSTPSKLVDALMDRPYRWFSEPTPLSIGLFKLQGELADHSDVYWYGGTQQPGEKPYRGDVYVLVDGGCFSACEDFVMPFRNSHRATLVGEKTAGSSGQPFVQVFDNGMLIQVGAKREFFPNGEEFEGVGISPDVDVHTTAADIESGGDPVLEKVTEMIRTKASKP
jgi:carboxyl-terminal processing protease